MDNSVFFISDSGNTYLYDFKYKMYLCVHPLIEEFYELDKKNVEVEHWKENISNNLCDSDDEFNHQIDKYFYLKKNGFFTQEKQNITKYNSDESTIRYNLSHINHIVFEVTDKCNLNCFYCAFGELYGNYDRRHTKMMSKEDAMAFVNFFVDLWKTSQYSNIQQNVTISFYGGEPLLNFGLIDFLVKYISNVFPQNIHPIFSMTTNGMLLGKYIDFLVKHKFHILVSLDGDKPSNSYRKQFDGGESYDKIYTQLLDIQKSYPYFFKNNINFNSVLHNRNSVKSINDYFSDNFNKRSNISELNPVGLSPAKVKEFNDIFKEKDDVFDPSKLANIIRSSITRKVATFLRQYSRNYYDDILNLYIDRDTTVWPCTGTCSPFSKKIFLTVNGKILPCERIGHNYPLGNLNNGIIKLDPKTISELYASVYDRINKQCKKCYMIRSCKMCIFCMENLSNLSCDNYGTKEVFKKYISSNVSLLEDKRNIYNIIISNILIH